jgi:hypothetical protein
MTARASTPGAVEKLCRAEILHSEGRAVRPLAVRTDIRTSAVQETADAARSITDRDGQEVLVAHQRRSPIVTARKCSPRTNGGRSGRASRTVGAVDMTFCHAPGVGHHDASVLPVGAVARAARLAGVVACVAFVAVWMAERRGLVLGLLAFVTYAFPLGAAAWSMSWLRRWSDRHIVVDASFLVPFLFFALLLIPVLTWWVAAAIALGIGAAVVPLSVHRRKRLLARSTLQTHR